MIQMLPPIDESAHELHQRMDKPQRHRLLHGYPLAAAMRSRRDPGATDLHFDPRSGRGLVVGVLPHPFCNPAVAGCGFCTFPHEKYEAARAAEVVAAVCREIDGRVRRQPELLGRPVTALYFGGGTANLSPAEPFRTLCRTLARAFDLSHAEVTLEGVPVYFLKRRPLLMDILREEMPARHFRISMGIQTFDERQLERMGRLAFGTEHTFRTVTEQAHARGFTISADLLFNLPHQTLAEMEQDVRQAVDLGLDHLGLYHLVLFRGLGTAWSRDPSLLAGLPENEAAAEHWLTLRQQLLDAAFYQTTLTNFEWVRFKGTPSRYLYEECSFQPHRFEMLGFGPSGVSFAAGTDFREGRKVLNPDAPQDYVAAVDSGGPVWDRYFEFGPRDLRIFYLTRRLAGLGIDRQEYRALFGTDPVQDFPEEFMALNEEDLLELTPLSIRPTPRGMFFADSIASLWARRRLEALPIEEVRSGRGRSRLNDNSYGHM